MFVRAATHAAALRDLEASRAALAEARAALATLQRQVVELALEKRQADPLPEPPARTDALPGAITDAIDETAQTDAERLALAKYARRCLREQWKPDRIADKIRYGEDYEDTAP